MPQKNNPQLNGFLALFNSMTLEQRQELTNNINRFVALCTKLEALKIIEINRHKGILIINTDNADLTEFLDLFQKVGKTAYTLDDKRASKSPR